MIKTACSLGCVVRNLCQYGSEGSVNCDDVGSVNGGASMAVGDVARVSAKGEHITKSHVVNRSAGMTAEVDVGAITAAGDDCHCVMLVW